MNIFFNRQSSINGKNAEIERLRAIAVIMIVHTHGVSFFFLPSFMGQSYPGVDLFFVISGYVITLSILKLLPKLTKEEMINKRLSKSIKALKIFYIRRMCRILPLTLSWLIIYYFLSKIFYNPLASSNIFGSPTDLLKEITKVLSLTYNFLAYYGLSGNISHYWSLSVEEQFYLILPLLFVIFFTIKNRIKASIIGFCLLIIIPTFIKAIVPPGPKFLGVIYAQRYFNLFFGVLIALIFSINKKEIIDQNKKSFVQYLHKLGSKCLALSEKISSLIAKPLIVLPLIFILWSLPGIASNEFNYNAGFVVSGLIATILVSLASLEKKWILNIPVLKNLLEYIGSRSFCIYLSHFAFIKLNKYWLSNQTFNIPHFYKDGVLGLTLQFIVVWSAMLFFAEIFYKVLESPFINLGKKYIRHKYEVDFDQSREQRSR